MEEVHRRREATMPVVERDKIILSLARRGHSYRKIGKLVGVHHDTVSTVVRRSLGTLPVEYDEMEVPHVTAREEDW